MAKAITSEKFVLGTAADPIRFSFLELENPKSFNNDPNKKKTYQASALLDPTNNTHKAQLAALNTMAKGLLSQAQIPVDDVSNYWNSGRSVELAKGYCFGKGNWKKYEGYKGMCYVSLANEVKPIIGDRTGKLVIPGEQGFPYSGAFGIIKGTLWLWQNANGKGMNANLLTVQFVKPGQAFSSRPQLNPDEEFERLPDDTPAGVTTASDDDFMN
jgi:ssDNA-binding protein